MSETLDIGAYLAEAAELGLADGQGEFTVSHQQAARKLARFSLPRASAWVAKLIQVGVRLAAHSIEIKQTVSVTFFHFQLEVVPTEEDIVAAIVSGAVDRGRPLDGLALALRAIVEQAGLAFLLVADDGKTVPRPVYAGAYPSRMSETARLDRRFHPNPGLSLTVFHRPSHLNRLDPEQLLESWRGHLPILEELRRTCFACPVPILGSSGPMQGLLSSSELGLGKSSRLVLLRGLRGLVHSPGSFPLPSDFEDKSPSLLAEPNRLRRSYGGSRLAQAALVVSVRLEGGKEGDASRRSRLLWLADGVVVQEERLSHLSTEVLQLTVLANASGLSTDLTGFSLIGNEEFRLRREEILKAAGLTLLRHPVEEGLFREDRDDHSHLDELQNQRGAIFSRLKQLAKASGPSLALATLSHILGAPAAVNHLLSGQSWRDRRATERLLARKEVVIAAIDRDSRHVVEQLTGDKPPPPPEQRVEFVIRKA